MDETDAIRLAEAVRRYHDALTDLQTASTVAATSLAECTEILDNAARQAHMGEPWVEKGSDLTLRLGQILTEMSDFFRDE